MSGRCSHSGEDVVQKSSLSPQASVQADITLGVPWPVLKNL